MRVDNFFLDKNDAMLLIVDIQDRLAGVMKEKDKVVKNTQHLIELAKMMGIPLVVTEQYPKGLGRTVQELQSVIPGYKPIEKTTFDCCGEPSFLSEVNRFGKKKIIVTGMETHVCVLQTTTSLLQAGFVTHVVQDAICSRTKENWKTGLAFMHDAGAVLTCTETVLFQLLRVAGTEEFKKISQRIK
ncbi:MAG TPA: hydrolase [Nitrospirota bacterium]|nr:hydrolase [Nitrospirota bacterium]